MSTDMSSKQKCYICKKDAVYRYSPDLDLRGLGACEEHKDEVMIEYYKIIYLDSRDD